MTKKKYESPRSKEGVAMEITQFLCESVPTGNYGGGKVYMPKHGASQSTWQEGEEEESEEF